MTFYVQRNGKKHRVVVDDWDWCVSLVREHTWWMKPNGYIYTQWGGRKNRKTYYLHRLIMSALDGQEVDHVNRNPLDNRLENLRFATRSQNNMNKSGVRGVSRLRGKWRARIAINGKEVHLGMYDHYVDALVARRDGEAQLFAEFANV